MLRRLRAFIRSTRGAGAVEFAMVLPSFLIVAMGTVEFGRLYWLRNSVQYAVEQSARYAIAHPDASDTDLVSLAEAEFDDVADGNFTVAIARDTVDDVDYVTVSATSNFAFLTAFFAFDGFTLSGESRVPLLD